MQNRFELASLRVADRHAGRNETQPVGASLGDASELFHAEIAHIAQHQIICLHQVNEILAQFAVLLGGEMQSLKNRFTGEKIEGEVRLATRRLSFAIAVPREVLGVLEVCLGLARILDKDPVENLRADQALLCPSLFKGLSGSGHHEGDRSLVHPPVHSLTTHRFLFRALQIRGDLVIGRLAGKDRLEEAQDKSLR